MGTFRAEERLRLSDRNSILKRMFSQAKFRPRDVLRGICLQNNYAYIYTWVHVQKTTLKETVLWGTITWYEMEKQNIQAKKV